MLIESVREGNDQILDLKTWPGKSPPTVLTIARNWIMNLPNPMVIFTYMSSRYLESFGYGYFNPSYQIMNISSINSRRFNSHKESLILIFDHARSFNFVFVQETQILNPNEINRLSARWQGPSIWSPAIGKQRGVAILVSQHFDSEILHWRKDSGGRILSLLVKVGCLKINLVNIYIPTNLTEWKTFYENLHQIFLPADYLILGGNFNCYERDLDKYGGNTTTAKYLSDFRSTFKLVDIWRKLHSHSREVTWLNSDFSIGSRLDKFLILQNLVSSIHSCLILPCCFSDHEFVNLPFTCDDNVACGPGLWNINNSPLSDTEFCDFASSRIADLVSCFDCFPSGKDWWDFFKLSIKSDIVYFAKSKHKNMCQERISVTNRLIFCKQRFVQGDTSFVLEIAALESQINALILKELEGSKIRSRVQWLEDGERPTR